MDCLICGNFVNLDQGSVELNDLAQAIQVFCDLLILESSHYEFYQISSQFFCMSCFDRLTSASHLFRELQTIQEKLKDLKENVQEEILTSHHESIKLIGTENEKDKQVHDIRLHICKDLFLLPQSQSDDEDSSDEESAESDNDNDYDNEVNEAPIDDTEIKKEIEDESSDNELSESAYPNSPFQNFDESDINLESLKGQAMQNNSILKIKRLEDLTKHEIEEALIAPSVELNEGWTENTDEVPKVRKRRKKTFTGVARKPVKPNVKFIRLVSEHKRFKLTCRICLAKYPSPSKLKIHHLEAHNNNIVKCDEPNCLKMFRTRKLSDSHRKRVHLKIGKKRTSLCPMCGKELQSSYLRVHMKTHDERQPSECEICHKTFMTQFGYEGHMKKFHLSTELETFMCHVCGKSLSSLSNLKLHEKQVHIKDFKFKCDICDHGAQTQLGLKKHKLSHLEEGTFKCSEPDCDKVFKSKTGYSNHLLLHKGAKPKLCKICGKGFRTTSQRNVHETIHTPHITPCACDTCGKRFTHKAYLKLHENWHKRVEARGKGPAKLRPRKSKESVSLIIQYNENDTLAHTLNTDFTVL